MKIAPCLAGVLVGLALSRAVPAAAADLTLEVEPCPAFDESELRRLLAIERWSDASPEVDVPSVVVLSCLAEGDVRVVAERRGRVQRVVRLADVDPRARERLLSLAVVELLRSTELDGVAEPPPAPAPAPAPVAPAIAPRARERADVAAGHGSPLSIDAAFMLHAWPADGHLTFGPRAGVSVALSSVLALVAGARFETGTKTVDLGRITARALGADAGLEARHVLGALRLGVALRLAAGWASVEGAADDASVARGGTESGAWTAVALEPTCSLSLARGLVAVARPEVGYVLWGVRGLVDGSRGPSWESLWVGGSLGLSWQP